MVRRIIGPRLSTYNTGNRTNIVATIFDQKGFRGVSMRITCAKDRDTK